jgi:peroxiredoxin
VIFAISVDPGDMQRGFSQEVGAAFRFISDTSRNLSALYGAVNDANELAYRQSVLIDKQGVVRWVDRNVKVNSHGKEVVAKMRELGLIK